MRRGELAYRRPMAVRVIRCFPTSDGWAMYPVCPHCRTTMEREYQAYCDRCGQALRWDEYARGHEL